jgi:hypothetical protein
MEAMNLSAGGAVSKLQEHVQIYAFLQLAFRQFLIFKGRFN